MKKFYGEISENLLEGTSLPLKYWPGKHPSFGLVECLAEIPRTSRALFLISAVPGVGGTVLAGVFNDKTSKARR